jgi:hypothetical protein
MRWVSHRESAMLRGVSRLAPRATNVLQCAAKRGLGGVLAISADRLVARNPAETTIRDLGRSEAVRRPARRRDTVRKEMRRSAQRCAEGIAAYGGRTKDAENEAKSPRTPQRGALTRKGSRLASSLSSPFAVLRGDRRIGLRDGDHATQGFDLSTRGSDRRAQPTRTEYAPTHGDKGMRGRGDGLGQNACQRGLGACRDRFRTTEGPLA